MVVSRSIINVNARNSTLGDCLEEHLNSLPSHSLTKVPPNDRQKIHPCQCHVLSLTFTMGLIVINAGVEALSSAELMFSHDLRLHQNIEHVCPVVHPMSPMLYEVYLRWGWCPLYLPS